VYEQRVESATSSLEAFRERLIRELDQRDGAFRWWSGSSDWKTLTMVADYLIQSIAGASEALVSASFAAQTHRETAITHSEALNAVWSRLAADGVKEPRAFIEAVPNDAAARTRRLRITQSAEQCFFHLGQTLDRVAAALIIVGRVRVQRCGECRLGRHHTRRWSSRRAGKPYPLQTAAS
jgi:hypothetical protein